MKLHKLLFLGIFILLFSSSVAAYTPEPPGFVEGLLFVDDKDGEIELGQPVDLKLLIKNSLNDSIHNITIFQEIEENTEFLEIMGFEFSGENMTLKDETVTEFISNTPITINYLNATTSNFTVNIEHTMAIGDMIGFDFSINVTETGTFNFEDPVVTYYDHWGDEYTAQRTTSFTIRVFEKEPSPIEGYLFLYPTTKTNYALIFACFGLVFFAALIGRVLYLKKPFVF